MACVEDGITAKLIGRCGTLELAVPKGLHSELICSGGGLQPSGMPLGPSIGWLGNLRSAEATMDQSFFLRMITPYPLPVGAASLNAFGLIDCLLNRGEVLGPVGELPLASRVDVHVADRVAATLMNRIFGGQSLSLQR